MEWMTLDIANLPRSGNFPFRVIMLYFSHVHQSHRRNSRTPENMFEFSIRLEPHEGICSDVINGRPIRVKFPNIVWKRPGERHHMVLDRPRDAISFGYPAKLIEEFRRLGLYPEQDVMPFSITPEIRRLCGEYRKRCLQLHTPGAADELDWICFQLYREVFYSRLLKSGGSHDNAERLRNISVWLQMNFSRPIELDELARANGFSRTQFFREWKRLFHISPAQYVLNLKMEAASRFLRETDLSIAAIVREVGFSGSTAFHKRFAQIYGMTPRLYRTQPPK